MKAIWNKQLIAESDNTIIIEGNHYFPLNTVDSKFLQPSQNHTTCYWKGVASYYHLNVDGKVNENAAWFYPSPLEKAKEIKDYVAFWKGVSVEK